jgi:hypothetical protein
VAQELASHLRVGIDLLDQEFRLNMQADTTLQELVSGVSSWSAGQPAEDE